MGKYAAKGVLLLSAEERADRAMAQMLAGKNLTSK